MKQGVQIEKFEIYGGGAGALADFGQVWVLTNNGVVITLGSRSNFTVTVGQLPHAWRILFSLGEATVWFDVDEAAAKRIEKMVGNSATKH